MAERHLPLRLQSKTYRLQLKWESGGRSLHCGRERPAFWKGCSYDRSRPASSWLGVPVASIVPRRIARSIRVRKRCTMSFNFGMGHLHPSICSSTHFTTTHFLACAQAQASSILGTFSAPLSCGWDPPSPSPVQIRVSPFRSPFRTQEQKGTFPVPIRTEPTQSTDDRDGVPRCAHVAWKWMRQSSKMDRN